MTETSLIVARELAFAVPGPNGEPVALLEGIGFAVEAGQWLHVIGASGSGKSTLLRAINRLIEPTGGALSIDGRDCREWPPIALRAFVGMVFQQTSMLDRNVRANLELPSRLAGDPPPGTDDLKRALRQVELPPDLLDRVEGDLSGGQRQRVAVARALMRRPRVLLLDEPTSSLDPPVARRLLATLERIRRETGLTLIHATHRMGELRDLPGEVLALERGRIVERGEVATILDRPTHAATRELMDAYHGRDNGGEEGAR
jgi:ABC-type methionine transport system ATPase subunit